MTDTKISCHVSIALHLKFVQNVFAVTRAVRMRVFPGYFFFSLHYIQAGTELTWDYSYDVGSVSRKTNEMPLSVS